MTEKSNTALIKIQNGYNTFIPNTNTYYRYFINTHSIKICSCKDIYILQLRKITKKKNVITRVHYHKKITLSMLNQYVTIECCGGKMEKSKDYFLVFVTENVTKLQFIDSKIILKYLNG